MTLQRENFDKIERYIKGEIEEEERRFVESLFLGGEENLYLRNCLKEDWERMIKEESVSQIDLKHILDKVHHIISTQEAEKKKKPLEIIKRYYSKAAAILLIPLLAIGSLIYFNMSANIKVASEEEVNSVIFAPPGSRVSFTLPDGTSGMLNSGSKLDYSIPFAKKRHIKLEGEAWFDVKHDPKNPFEINVGKSTVKVLGTIFGVSAYPTENYTEVVLKQGNVEFIENNNGKTINILPSERLIYQTGKYSKSIVDPDKYYGWTEGKLVFRGDPMGEVVRRIERWYNVKIKLASKDLEQYSFRATFEDDRLEEVLKLLTLTSPITYSTIPSIQLPDGSVTKEEITIYNKAR
jgi:transmembrane sensor